MGRSREGGKGAPLEERGPGEGKGAPGQRRRGATCYRNPPETATLPHPPLSYDSFTGYGKQVVGHATEYSLATVLGNVSLSHPLTHWNTYCAQFVHTCVFPGSPCVGRYRRPKDLCPLDSYSDDEVEPELPEVVVEEVEEVTQEHEGWLAGVWRAIGR